MKYTFEIMKEYEDAFKGISVYSVSEDKKLMVDFVALEELEDAQKEINEAYQRGLEDAWEAARKIVVSTDYGGIASETLLEIFGMRGYSYIMQDNTAQEAIDKIKAYEEKQKEDDFIEVGDEVVTRGLIPGNTFLVTKVTESSVYGISNDGSWNFYNKDSATKTGKHYDIASILEAMRNG